MKNSKSIVLLSCLFCLAGSAQGNQLADNTDARKISSAYHTLVVSSGLTADLFSSNHEKVFVKASRNDYHKVWIEFITERSLINQSLIKLL